MLVRVTSSLRGSARMTASIPRRGQLFSTSSTCNASRILLFTGTDCSLCDVVKETLYEVQKEIPFELELYNIRDDSLPGVAKYRRAYQYDIPVVHLNGKEIARHRLDRSLLQTKLRAAKEGESASSSQQQQQRRSS